MSRKGADDTGLRSATNRRCEFLVSAASLYTGPSFSSKCPVGASTRHSWEFRCGCIFLNRWPVMRAFLSLTCDSQLYSISAHLALIQLG